MVFDITDNLQHILNERGVNMRNTIKFPAELKQCPFCKGRGVLFKEPLRSSGYYGNSKYSVGCNNQRCKVKPRTKELDDVFDDKDIVIKMVIGYWNER